LINILLGVILLIIPETLVVKYQSSMADLKTNIERFLVENPKCLSSAPVKPTISAIQLGRWPEPFDGKVVNAQAFINVTVAGRYSPKDFQGLVAHEWVHLNQPPSLAGEEISIFIQALFEEGQSILFSQEFVEGYDFVGFWQSSLPVKGDLPNLCEYNWNVASLEKIDSTSVCRPAKSFRI